MGRAIVVGVAASSADTDRALDWAAAEAGRRGVPLRLVHSMGGLLARMVSSPDLARATLTAAAQDVLDQAAARVAVVAPDVHVDTVVDLDASAPTSLLAAAADAEMLVLGSHDRTALGDVLVSSATPEIVKRAAGPVVVVRPHASYSWQAARADVVIGVDGSTTSSRAVAWAFQEASLWKTGVTAVHVWGIAVVGGSEPTMYGLLEPAQLERAEQEHAALLSESLAGWREEWPNVAVHEALVRGHPGQALVEASARARLLVVGTRGHGGFPGLLLGSVSSAVVHHAHCPVMVVRP